MEDRKYAVQRLLQMQNVFGEPGWKLVIEEAVEEIEVLKDSLVESKTWDDARFIQGKIDQLIQLVFLEQSVDAMLASFDDNDPYKGDDWEE